MSRPSLRGCFTCGDIVLFTNAAVAKGFEFEVCSQGPGVPGAWSLSSTLPTTAAAGTGWGAWARRRRVLPRLTVCVLQADKKGQASVVAALPASPEAAAFG